MELPLTIIQLIALFHNKIIIQVEFLLYTTIILKEVHLHQLDFLKSCLTEGSIEMMEEEWDKLSMKLTQILECQSEYHLLFISTFIIQRLKDQSKDWPNRKLINLHSTSSPQVSVKIQLLITINLQTMLHLASTELSKCKWLQSLETKSNFDSRILLTNIIMQQTEPTST